jgi:hypothetical protein
VTTKPAVVVAGFRAGLDRGWSLQSDDLSVPRAWLLVKGRRGQQLVMRRRAIRLWHPGGAWERRRCRGPGESYSDVILRVAKGRGWRSNDDPLTANKSPGARTSGLKGKGGFRAALVAR